MTLCVAGSILVTGGCAVHPLPEDVTGISTTMIAERIRCEARDAVRLKAIQMLRAAAVRPVDPIPGAEVLAERLAQDPGLFKTIGKHLKNPREKTFYERYIKTSIAYDFTFDMSEDNLASTQLDFVKLVTGGTFSLALGASNDRLRENIRKFLITDTFENLVTKDIAHCDEVPVGPNLVYPIIGRIGLYELISTFIDLNEDGFTFSPKDKAPALADQLQFNTTFSGTATPKIVLSPIVGHNFHLADAALTNTATRTDKHAVIIGLSLKKAEPPRPASPLGIGIVARSIFASRDLSESGLRAVEAIAQFRVDLYYDRSASVVVR